MAPNPSGGARYKSCPSGWQLPLAVAFSLVVLALDLDLGFEVVGLVSQIVGVFQRLVALDIGQFVSGERRLIDLLLGGRLRRRCGRRRCGRSRRRRCAAAAPHLHEVLTVVLAAALRAFDWALVQVV